jgi:hypothetical protein
MVQQTSSPETAPPTSGGIRLSEDWAATLVGLVLVLLVLVGVIAKGLVP